MWLKLVLGVCLLWLHLVLQLSLGLLLHLVLEAWLQLSLWVWPLSLGV